MPDQDMDEPPDVPGDIQKDIQLYECTKDIQMDAQTYRHVDVPADMLNNHPYVMYLCLHLCM